MALRPNSPKEMVEPRHALPVMRPRCCFLNLTFFGIIMAVYAPIASRLPASPEARRRQVPAGLPVSMRAAVAAATSRAAESGSPDGQPDAANPRAASEWPD